MPENNEPQYELDKDYAPLGIVDAADGSGTTWPEFVEQVDKMDNQVAALTEYSDSQSRLISFNGYKSGLMLTLGSVDVSSASSNAYVPMFTFFAPDGTRVGAISFAPATGKIDTYNADMEKTRTI